MQLVLLILLIPFCSVGFFVYLNSLMNYAFNDVLNVPLFSVGIAVSLVLGFIVFNLFSSSRVLSAKKLNFENNVMPYFSYYSFIILALFGVTLIINSILYNMNIFVLGIGVFIILMYLYITFFYMFKYKTDIFILSSIDDYEEEHKELDQEDQENTPEKEKTNIKCLNFDNDDIGSMEYYIEEGEYFPEKHYKVLYNPKLKLVKKVLNEVTVIE